MALGPLLSLPAAAAPFTYQYFRFKPTAIQNNGNLIQLSEFTFSNGGTLLNLRDTNATGPAGRNGTEVNIVPVTVSSAGQGTAGNEDPFRVVDGLPLENGGTETKWLRVNPTVDGNELVFNFGTAVTVDSYNFATGGDSTVYSRTPVSWQLAGSDDGTTWTLLDVRVNAIPLPVTNLTYQAGFEIPASIPPVVDSFGVRNTALEGTAAIVTNGQSVTLDWTTRYAESVMFFQGAEATNVAATGSLAVTPGPNATTPYNLIALKDGSPAAVGTALVRTVEGGPETYRYVRYTLTKRRGTGSNLVQISEFEFYNGDSSEPANKVPVASVTNAGGDNINADQVPAKIIDGMANTKWLDVNNRPLVFDFGAPVTFDRYLFVTGGDAPDRDPVQWIMEGSNDQVRWDLIEQVDFDYPTPMQRNFSSRAIPLPGASLPVRIDFFTGNTGTVIFGEPLTLTYSTQGAASVTLDPATGDVLPLYGSITVNPTEDTTYTLTAASGLEGSTPVTATFSIFMIEDPGVDDIAYDDFAAAGQEIVTGGSATITSPDNALPNRLRLTPEQQGQNGSSWFIKKLNVSAGFEATFGMSLNQEFPNNVVPADGLAFVVQNAPSGTGEPGTGENGVPQNALNICFHTFGFAADPASLVEIRSGTQVLARTIAYEKPGVELHGIPGVDANGIPNGTEGFPYTLGSLASDPAYRIRVVYVPGDLDVYLDGIAIVQNVNVNLTTIGAADSTGKSYFGFTARTGGNVQNSDITDWHVNLGDFSALPPFGMVKSLFRYTPGTALPTSLDLVWNASAGMEYNVESSLDMTTWSMVTSEPSVNGQIGVKLEIPFVLGDIPDFSKAFLRVKEATGE